MINIISFTIALLVSISLLPLIINMLKTEESLETNYRGLEIPISTGIVFIYSQVFTMYLILLINDNFNKIIIIYLLLLVFMGTIGLLDDLAGNKDVKGFKGHIMLIFKRQLSTGGLKALTGLLLSISFAVIISNGFFELIVNTLIIALFTNTINLLDLRPGRGCKAFIIFGIILLITSKNSIYNHIIYCAFGFCAAFLPFDLREKTMMGDIGSNSLGITLGIFCVMTNIFYYKIVYLLLLIIIHLVGEKYSITKIISNNRLLSLIDNLGRCK